MGEVIRTCAGDTALEPMATGLAAAARRFYERGWMLGTSGSVSSRVGLGEPLQIAVTVSGKPKGELSAADLLLVIDDGEVFETLGDPQASSSAYWEGKPRPSGETLVHEALYRRFPDDAGAVYHVHSVDNTLCSQMVPTGQRLMFQDLEMLKGIGRWEPGQPVGVPVVPNHPHIPTLADAVREAADPKVPGVLVQGHGIYVWGQDMARAQRHVEIFEFLFSYEVKRRLLGL